MRLVRMTVTKQIYNKNCDWQPELVNAVDMLCMCAQQKFKVKKNLEFKHNLNLQERESEIWPNQVNDMQETNIRMQILTSNRSIIRSVKFLWCQTIAKTKFKAH